MLLPFADRVPGRWSARLLTVVRAVGECRRPEGAPLLKGLFVRFGGQLFADVPLDAYGFGVAQRRGPAQTDGGAQQDGGALGEPARNANASADSASSSTPGLSTARSVAWRA